MGKQIFNIKGMTRDMGPAKVSNQYAYEIRNLRLTNLGDSTMLALESEKGNAQYTITGDSIEGTIIGYCVLNDYIVLFTYFVEKRRINHIYRLDAPGTALTLHSKELYSGDLNMLPTDTIEAIGIYEHENLQKVYWIDGRHQPRSINIVADDTTMQHWQQSDSPFDFVPKLKMQETVKIKKAGYNGLFNAGTIQYILTYYNRNGQQTAAFYQSPINYIASETRGASPEDTVNNSFSIKVINPDDDFDYVRIYSVFRSSENGTPICKKVCDLRTEDTSTESVTYETREFIRLTNITLGTSTNVNYVSSINFAAYTVCIINNSNNREVPLEDFLAYRLGNTSYYNIDSNYSMFVINNGANPLSIMKIQAATGEFMSVWKSGNVGGVNKGGASQLKKWAFGQVTANVIDDPRTQTYIEYIDNGLSQEVVSYSEILFAGGANIIPATMAQKSQTLFFGNYTSNAVISESDKDIIKGDSTIYFGYSIESVDKGTTGNFYMYDNQLDGDAKKITTFKGGETYHFGIILQDDWGSWTDVIPIGAVNGDLNSWYPKDGTNTFCPVKAYIYLGAAAKEIVDSYKAVKVVRLDTLPTVIYQGVLSPTVFNKKRESNSPFCMASWFFRPIKPGKVRETSAALVSNLTQNSHNGNIREGLGMNTPATKISEIQGARADAIGYYDGNISLAAMSDMDMFVDWNTVTLNSPDIDFGLNMSMNYKMRIVGILPISASRTSMVVTWKNDPITTSIANHLDYTPINENNLSTDGFKIDLNVLAYKDGYAGSGDLAGTYLYPIYPWHRNGSLSGQATPIGNEDWNALLDTKVMASLREAARTIYLPGPIYEITKPRIYQEDETLLLLEEDTDNYIYEGTKIYAGSMDVALMSTSNGYKTYGISVNSGSSPVEMHSGVKDPVRMRFKSSKHGVFSLKSQGNLIFILPNVGIEGVVSIPTIGQCTQLTSKAIIKGKLTPTTVSSSNDLFTLTGNIDTSLYNNDDVIMLTNPGYPDIYYVKSRTNASTMVVSKLDLGWLERHPNGDEILVSEQYGNDSSGANIGDHWVTTTKNIYFKYHDSTYGMQYYQVQVQITDAWVHDPNYVNDPPTQEITFIPGTPTLYGTIPDDQSAQITQIPYDISSVNTTYAYMYLAEFYTNSMNYNLENTPWIVASEPQKTGRSCIEASIGDTYYQRYDCLKTYPYSTEDQNQIVEIFSFMCETRINIDGRYDNRRGQADNTTVNETNFNLLNKGYTQSDNFYTYQYLDSDDFNVSHFPNQIIWTKTKTYGSDIDAWTQILPTSTLDMDGSLGQVQALRLWNDNLICFQDMGIARIMYNDRTTMSTEQDVPVEIANSGKVDGSQYISNTVGCSNKKSIQITQEGMYFIDSNTREIYKLAQGLEPLSEAKGFNAYFYDSSKDLSAVKAFYDPGLRDVYFRMTKTVGVSSTVECLVYNEQLKEFTSFFDYDMDFLFPFKDSLIAVEHNRNRLWKQFAGSEYLRYFGKNDGASPTPNPEYEMYSIELVCNENPTDDKIFNEVEFRADVLSNNITQQGSQAYIASDAIYASINKLPFTDMRVWNEYQATGDVPLETMIRKNTNLVQKYRIWRAMIGRDVVDKDHKFNRIRSPWARVRLYGGDDNVRAVIHDIAVMYTS
jgi:hypothetical protein